jgi:hypothetical protein
MKQLLILIMFMFVACTTKPVKEPAKITPVKKTNLVTVLSTKGFTEQEKEKLLEYIPVMNKTIDSKCFKDFMIARDLKRTNELTREQVVNKLRTSNVEIHLITYFKRFSKVHGYTYPNVNKIWLNRKYHRGASLCSEASNLAHELSHKLGFKHDFKATLARPYSVPYSINAGFEHCCK